MWTHLFYNFLWITEQCVFVYMWFCVFSVCIPPNENLYFIKHLNFLFTKPAKFGIMNLQYLNEEIYFPFNSVCFSPKNNWWDKTLLLSFIRYPHNPSVNFCSLMNLIFCSNAIRDTFSKDLLEFWAGHFQDDLVKASR